MRPAVLEFARDVAAELPIAEPLVEIGARVAEGQEGDADLRSVFAAGEHIGCDIQDGLGVDRIEDVHRLSFPDASVGTVICLETLEHVGDPIRAVAEMHRVLRPGGVLAVSSLMFFPIHAHPWDYWRFTPEGFELLLRPFESSYVTAQGWHLMPEGVFGIAVKGPADLGPAQLPRTEAIAASWGVGTRVDFGPIRLTARQAWRYALQATGDAVAERVRRRRTR
jgi:SAM-dependent methyltransferase